MSGLFQIQPISIPQSAALNFAGGDVRHISSIADALNGDALSNPTRMLAYRDVLLAEKVNELIQSVNNKDQFINLPLPVTTLPGGATQVISNYRIPPGFEARILNAKISSTPASSIQLKIGYNNNQFGLTSFTTTPVATFDEVATGTSFYGTGEFVVQLVNVGGRTATATASVMLTMRPVAAQKGGIIGPGAVGPKGEKGDKGDKGDQGNPGLPGPSGPVGMNWRGTWSSATGYSARDVVNYGGSAWFAKTPSTNVAPPDSPDSLSAVWDLTSRRGFQGYQGFQGSQGVQGAQGTGAQGAQGAQGTTGAQGDFGATGNQGAQGDAGSDGAQGAQGSTGAQGETGAQGFQGDIGAQGYQGDAGSQGDSGSQGQGFNLAGVYDPGSAYDPYDVVTVTDGTHAQVYAAVGNVGVGIAPPAAPWQPLLAPGGGSLFDRKQAQTASVTGGDYEEGNPRGLYDSIPAGSNYPDFSWIETSAYGNLTGYEWRGVSTIRGTRRAVFKGELTVMLPTTLNGLNQTWSTSDLEIMVANHGTVAGAAVEVTSLDGESFTVEAIATAPFPVQITVVGTKAWPQ